MKAAPQKRCSSCNQLKPLTQFHKRKLSRDGLQARCKPCRYTENADHFRRSANGSLDGFLSYLVTRARQRARKRGLPFDLTTDHILALWRHQSGRCALTGRHLHTQMSRGHARPETCTIDRITPSLGYVEGNIRLVTHWSNVARHNLSDDQLIDWANALTGHLTTGTTATPQLNKHDSATPTRD